MSDVPTFPKWLGISQLESHVLLRRLGFGLNYRWCIPLFLLSWALKTVLLEPTCSFSYRLPGQCQYLGLPVADYFKQWINLKKVLSLLIFLSRPPHLSLCCLFISIISPSFYSILLLFFLQGGI